MAKKKEQKEESKSETVLLLRTSDKHGKSYGGFQWPKSGHVKCPDWDKRPICGYGLHGLLWGEGNGGYLSWESDSTWIVFEALASEVVDLGGDKVKVPEGTVVFYGDRKGATEYIAQRRPGSIVGLQISSGDGGTSTSGDRGTSTSGDGGTSTSGYRGTSTSGYGGTSTSGDGGILVLRWFDGNRYRLQVFYVGEDGIEPNTAYRLDEKGKIQKVEKL